MKGYGSYERAGSKKRKVTYIRIDLGGTSGRKKLHIFTCDECGVEFTGRKDRIENPLHFCSRKCNFQSQRTGKRRKTTVESMYRARKVFLQKMGVQNVSQLPEVREKIAVTCSERYGSKTFFGSHTWRRKATEAYQKRYGADWYTQTDDFKRKFAATCIERYGTHHHLKSDDVKAAIDYERASRRRHTSMKKNGSYSLQATAVEDTFYKRLCETFGVGAVRRHVEVNGWCIDFHIEPIDLYVQFDGVYWHGLDRPIEVIREFRSPRDRTIYGTWLRDRKQDAWFEENGMLLLRVTDRDDSDVIVDMILCAAEQLVQPLSRVEEEGQTTEKTDGD